MANHLTARMEMEIPTRPVQWRVHPNTTDLATFIGTQASEGGRDMVFSKFNNIIATSRSSERERSVIRYGFFQ